MQAQAKWDPDLGYWVRISDSEHSEWFSGSFPRSGMTAGGTLFLHPKPDSPTSASGSSSSQRLPTPRARDWKGKTRPGFSEPNLPNTLDRLVEGNWDAFLPAIERAEERTGRPAPDPVEPNRNGNPRVTGKFVEWLMGLPDGWVTDTPKLTRKAEFTMLGNGVVPQQAALALRRLTQIR